MSAIIDIVTEKCPKCSKGKVFRKKGNPLLFIMPRMNENCPVCNHKFEKEPGYFFGSMFVSYAIAVGEMIIFFFLVHLFIKSFGTIIILISLLSILLSTFNFRMSRMVWIYMLDGKNRQI